MDGDISAQLENWKEQHPEATVAQEAPDKPCFVCQRAAEALKDPAARKKREDNMQAFQTLLYNRIHDTLSEDGSQLVMITEESCPPCDSAMEIFRPFIENGNIEVLPYAKCDPKDKECIAAQGITAVPVLVARKADGKFGKFFPLAGPSSIPIGDAHE